jgi:hypothetical protein
VNLGDACSGLDANLAEAVGTAILARLKYGPEVEPLLGEILRVSGVAVSSRSKRANSPETRRISPSNGSTSGPYLRRARIAVPTAASAATLRQLAAAAERRERAAAAG